MKVKFTVPGEPKGKQRPRFSRKSGTVYTPKDTVEYEELVGIAYRQRSGGVRFDEKEPLQVDIVAEFAYPKRLSKAKRLLAWAVRKPDADNIGKIICDSLNKIAYHDDAQVVKLSVTKRYADTAKVCVEITGLGG